MVDNPFALSGGDLYLRQREEQEARQLSHLMLLSGGELDRVEEAFSLSQRTGLSPHVVLGNLEGVRDRVSMSDTAEGLALSPRLRGWLGEDRLNRALAQGDINNLVGIERFLDTQFGRGLQTGALQVPQMAAAAGTIPVIGMLTGDAQLLGLFEQAAAMDPSTPRWEVADALGLDANSRDAALVYDYLRGDEASRQDHIDRVTYRMLSNEDALSGLVELYQSYSEQMQETQGRVPNFTDIRDLEDFGDWIFNTTGQALPLMAISALSGYIGGLPGVMASGYGMGVGDIMGSQVENENLTPEAAVTSLVGAVPYGAMELVGVPANLTRAFSGVTPQFLQTISRNWLMRQGRSAGVNAIEEFINEVGQEIISDYAVQAGGGEEVVLDNETLWRWFNAGMAGFGSGFAIGGVTPNPAPREVQAGTNRDLERLRNAGRTAEFLAGLSALAGSSQVRERAPQQFQTILSRLGARNTAVYVPAGELRIYAQEANLDLGQLGVDEAEMRTMEQSGGMVAMPVDRIGAHLVGTEAIGWLSEHGVLNPDTEMSLAQQAAIGRSLMDAAMEDARRIREGDRQLRTSDQQVFDRVRAQLREAGRSPDVAENEATFFAAFFRTMAERYGADTLELYERFGVRIERAVSTSSESGVLSGVQATDNADVSGQTLQQAAQTMQRTPEFQQWFGNSAVVDEAGSPLVVYHGTNADVDADFAFDPDLSVGSFMGDDGSIAPIFLTPDRPYAERMGQNLVEAYVSIQNPLRVDVLAMGREEASNAGMPLPETVAEAEQILGSYDQILEALYMSGELDGHDGVIFTETDDSIGRGADQIVVFDPSQIKDIRNPRPTSDPRLMYQDNGDTGPRGQIEIPAAGVDAGTTVIKLFDGADLSTVLHEAGHYFYEVFATLASDPRAPEQMKADLAALQEWAGVEPGKAPSVEALENIARGMERYTLEGKAPSAELASVFGRFKAWLLRVYQTVKQRRLNVKLTPEVREVFDRMLATDAEIAQARDLAGDSALLKSAPPGMSEATWAAYQRLQRQKVERAEQTLLERTMAAVRRRKEAWWKDERATRVQDEMDRLGNQPEYRVIRAFADGDWAGVEGAVEGADLRLDRAALEEMFGEGITNDLAPAKFGMSRAIYTTAKHPDGMHPSEAAELFGFASASEMIDALRGAGNRRAIAEATVDQAMAQEHGDPFADGTIEAEALDAVHNDRKGEAMALELRYIAERLGRDGRREQTASFKARARAIIGGLTVQQATKPAHFLQAERQASRRAQEAFAAGRLEEAYQAKEQEALNHYLFVEATKIEKLVARKREQMRNYDRADVRQKVGPREMEQIDAILQDYEFRKRTQRALDRTMSLRQYIEKMTEEGREAELMLDADLLDEVRRQHYSRLSVDDLMAVFDAVDNLDNLGRTKTDIRNGLDKIKLRKAAATVAQQIRDNFGTGRRGKESRLRSTMNLLWTADTILVEMDGTDEYGEAYRLIKEALDAGQSREQQMHVELAQRLEDLFSVYSQEDLTEMRKQRHVSGADARAWSKLEIISLALNMGNADNIQRVLSEDINKDFRLNRDQVDALLDTLDKRDWDFVQSMWDQIDSYWPEIQAVTTRRTGVKPRKVEATPVQTRFGVYRGGYYPIAYDPSSSGRSSVDAVSATDQFMSAGRYGKAQTAHGHTIARKQNSNGRALLFDLNVAFRHMRDVVRDIALSEAVDGAYRILNDEEVHSAFIEAGRENDFRVLNMWLKDLARGPIYNTDSLNSAARFIKNNFTLSRLAFNLKTAILQITGIGQSAATVGKRAMVEGYAEYLKRPQELAQEVTQLSPFMAERQSTFQKDIYDFANDVKLASPLASRWHKTKNKVSQWGFAPMMWAQFYAVDMPTWIAGYRSGLERFGNEEQAVRYADRMVARSQDSGLFGDRAAMSRGTMSETTRQSDFIRLFTTLAGYMMTKLNRANLTVRRGVKGMREGATIEEQASAAFNMAADLALLYVTEAAMMALMYSLILDDEDEPDYAAFFGREVSAAIFGGLPFVRDAAAAFTGFGGGGVYGSVGELPYRVWQQTVNQDWENDAALRRAIGDLVGTTTGLPTTASLRLIEGVVNEDDRPFAEALVGRNQLTR